MFEGGAWTRFERALGLLRRDGRPSVRRILLVSIALWAPLPILAGVQSGSLAEALRLVLGDFATTVRSLFTVPILLCAGYWVDRRISFMLRGMMAEELIPPSNAAAWDVAIEKARRRMTGAGPLLALAILAVAASLVLPPQPASEAWTTIGPPGQGHLSWAGIWLAALTRPMAFFLILVWLWRWVSLTLLAWAAARMPLQLQMGHPDRVGGLAVLGDFAAGSNPMILASGAVVSANLAWQMVNRGVELTSLVPVIAGFLILSMLYGLGPQLLFAPALIRLRRQGRLAYGALAAKHARLFEDRWFAPGQTTSELLGAPEISSLTDLAASYQLVRTLRPLPFGQSTVVSVLLAALIPMLPVALLEAPLKVILVRLLKVLI